MGQTFYLTTLNMFVGQNADAWPSQETLAAAMNATKRAVQKWQAELVAAGIIEVDSGKGCRASNRYRLRLDRLPQKGKSCFAPNDEPDSSFTETNSEPRSSFIETNSESDSPFDGRNSEPRSSAMANHVRLNSEPRAHRKDKNYQEKDQAVALPEKLNCDQFRTAWAEWVAFRRESRKRLTPSTINKQLTMLAGWGPAKAVRAIERSIRNGWQGLFDPDEQAGKAIPGDATEAEDAWQTVIDSLRRHSRYRPQSIQAEIGERAWQALRPFSLKRIDEATDFELRELRQRFLQQFSKQKVPA